MKEQKLISCADFVLQESKLIRIRGWGSSTISHLNCIFNYAKFLKQPLKLEMFIPCHKGKPFSEFQIVCLRGPDELPELRLAYKQAEEKVLFKDCSMFDEFQVRYGNGYLLHIKSWIGNESTDVEFLVKANLELTDSAIKQLGL